MTNDQRLKAFKLLYRHHLYLKSQPCVTPVITMRRISSRLLEWKIFDEMTTTIDLQTGEIIFFLDPFHQSFFVKSDDDIVPKLIQKRSDEALIATIRARKLGKKYLELIGKRKKYESVS